MVRGPLPPIVNQAANQAVKGLVAPQVQKLIDAQVSRVTAPLIARIEELERRLDALEKNAPAPTATRGTRSSDI
jgi:hypothetical protein